VRQRRKEEYTISEELRGTLLKFKQILSKRVSVHKVILFGSNARGEARSGSDVDVVVILKDTVNDKASEAVSDCAWEAGFEAGLVIVSVVFSRDEWESGPERHSLLARAVASEGIAV
jgi:predicted nucleotidyltransferase